MPELANLLPKNTLASQSVARKALLLSLGIEVGVTHHRAVREGYVTARTEPVHVGGTIVSYNVPVHDDEGRRIATRHSVTLKVKVT